MLEKITEGEINERSMARVSTTPGRRTAFGESKMDPEALKLRFDRLGRFLAGKINEILGSIEDGSIAEYIYVDHDGNKISVEQFITNLLNGDVNNIRIKINGKIVYLTEIAMKTEEMYNGQVTGDLANHLYIVDGVTLKGFYEEFKKLEESGGGNGKSAYDYAVEGGYTGTEQEFAQKLAKELPTKLSELDNDKKFITASGAPVQSVNSKTGEVKLNAEDVSARPNTWMPSYSDVNADKAGTAQSLVSGHNTNTGAHNDIRLELKALADRINAALDSDDTTLDELSEIVTYIKSNKTLIDSITTSKVNVADIINNLTTNVTNKPLSAAQGVALKALIDALDTNKLDASALASAINTALAQAKASGEFDGADGKDGVGIADIGKVYTQGLVDTYRITLTNADARYFDVTNGKDGPQGFGIVASVDRPAFTSAQWDTYGTIGREENWGGTSNDGVRVGDIFIVVGTATDTGVGHMLVYKYTGVKGGATLSGECIAHHLISSKGEDGKTPVKGTDYFTPADKTEMVNSVIAALPKYNGGVH